jgi:hypothetical protein
MSLARNSVTLRPEKISIRISIKIGVAGYEVICEKINGPNIISIDFCVMCGHYHVGYIVVY